MTRRLFAMGSTMLLGLAAGPVQAADKLVFNSVTPCRLIDTRLSAPGALAANATRTFHVVGAASDFVAQGGKSGGCGLPGFAGPGQPQVQAVLINIVAVSPTGAGDLRGWASDGPAPLASILNYAKVSDETLAGVPLNVANGIGLPVRQDVEGGDISIKADVSSTHVVADVLGYWRYLTQVDGSGSGLDADLLDGLDSTAFAAAVHTHPWSEITGKPAGFADNIDNDVLGGLSCATGEVAKWNGTAWACAADLVGGGAGWGLTGNAGTNPVTNFLGTTDNQAFELRVNNLRTLRLEPRATAGNYQGPNVVLGYEGNALTAGVQGAVVAGGGGWAFGSSPNQVTGHFGTVGGGSLNRAGDLDGDPTTGLLATVGGGGGNTASGTNATIGGGSYNAAIGTSATVGGGELSTASGNWAVVPGGYNSQAGGRSSFAAGNRAKVRDATQSGDADGDEGTFVWADSTNADFLSTGPNQFLIRAAGGVGVNKNSPASALDVAGTATVTGFRLSTAPTAGYVLTTDATGLGTWQPGAAGDITAVNAGPGLSGGGLSGDVTLAVDTKTVQSRVTEACPSGSSIRAINGDGTVKCQLDTTGADWGLTGNTGTSPATNFIGTTDNQAFELRVNNLRALRIEPRATTGFDQSPNIVLGYESNSVSAGVQGAVVAGGGGVLGGNPPLANQVTGNFGTVGGGLGNASGAFATVGGGQSNTASGGFATVGGGFGNTVSGYSATVGGGVANTASDYRATVGGGYSNTASGTFATVGGGQFNTASGGFAAVGGGQSNTASGQQATVAGGDSNNAIGEISAVGGGRFNSAGTYGTVPGGVGNEAGGQFSFAAGRQAKIRYPAQSGDADGDEGTFVWADSTFADFQSTGPNQFLIRAGGGVGINTNSPSPGGLTVASPGKLTFGSQTRQMIDLWSNAYAIGVQSSTQYFRADGGFAWFQGGVHADAQNDPGGGNRQMRLDASGNLFVRGTVNPGGADFAEMLPAERGLEAGDVVAIGRDGSLVKSGEPYQMAVAGVVSTQPGVLGGAADGEDTSGKVPLAVVGIVPVKASAEAGPIHPGDRLVASATPGHAMRSAREVRVGSVIGKALSALEAGTGVVRMLVVLQ